MKGHETMASLPTLKLAHGILPLLEAAAGPCAFLQFASTCDVLYVFRHTRAEDFFFFPVLPRGFINAFFASSVKPASTGRRSKRATPTAFRLERASLKSRKTDPGYVITTRVRSDLTASPPRRTRPLCRDRQTPSRGKAAAVTLRGNERDQTQSALVRSRKSSAGYFTGVNSHH